MISSKYQLRFISLFNDDLKDLVDYICDELNNPDAARRLVDDVENAISKRVTNPKAFEPFKSNTKRKYSYYQIYVRN